MKLFAAGPLLVLLAAPTSPEAAADESERLGRIRAEIEEREAAARELAEEAQGVLGELEGIDRELVETRRSLQRLRRRERVAEEELSTAREKLNKAQRAREDVEGALQIRLVALYKFRATGGAPALAQARDFQTFARLSRGLSQVLSHDAELFAEARASERRVRESHAEARDLALELALARREIGRREDRVRHKLVERKNFAALLRSRAEGERRAAEELREAARRLEEAIRNLPEGLAPAGPGLPAGGVPRPVPGPVRLSFGRQVDPEFGTETLRTGIEIAASAGTPVTTVGRGRVLFAGWFRGYGQMVIIDHGRDTMTVSGYLQELGVGAGEAVAARQEIGTVGETGSLSGPGLYFEIRKDGTAVDPEHWLE